MDVMDIDEWMQLRPTLSSAPDRFLEAEAKFHSDYEKELITPYVTINAKRAETEMLGGAIADETKRR